MAQLTEQQQNRVNEIKQQLNNEYQICFSEMLEKYSDTKVQEILNKDIKEIRIKVSQYKARKKAKSNNDIVENTESNAIITDILEQANKLNYIDISQLITKLEQIRNKNKTKYIAQLERDKQQAEKNLQKIKDKLQSLQ